MTARHRTAGRTAGVIGVLVAADMAVALFERLGPRPWVTAWRRFANPRLEAVLGAVPGWAVIETTGRKSGRPRRTPVGGRLEEDGYWFVTADGTTSQYVRNILADPGVRLRTHGRWRVGTAHVLAEDDAAARMRRLNPLNSMFIAIAGRRHVSVRVDFDRAAPPVPAPGVAGA